MSVIRATATWWRLVAAAVVLLTGYTVSHYVSAATVAAPTPAPNVVVVEATPLVVVVTATASPRSERAMIARTPSPTSTVTPPQAEPTRRSEARPSRTPEPTLTPTAVPLVAEQVEVVARIPLHPAGDRWSEPDGRLAWLPDGGGLVAADGGGIRQAMAPTFNPVAASREQIPGAPRDLQFATDGRRVAFIGADAVGIVDVETGSLDSVAAESGRPSRLLRWLPDGRLIATYSCGESCEQLVALSADGVQPVLDFRTEISPTIPSGMHFLVSPTARLVAFQTAGEPYTVIADPMGDWWYLGGWRERERLRAYDQAASWVDETILLSYHRSPSGPTVNGHGLDLWRWDVLANVGRFLVADVASAAPAPDGERVALVLLGRPGMDEAGHLVGGRWRPDEPLPVTLAVMDLERGAVLQQTVLAEHPGAPEPAALDGWPALRAPIWSPDGRTLLAFDGEGRPLLFDTAVPEAPPLPLLEQGQVQDVVWSPEGSRLALRAGDEVLIVALGGD